MIALQTLTELIKQYGTVREFSAFLQGRGFRGGSTWQQLIDSRLVPALRKHELAEGDVLEFLREVEEHGNQHVFLYRYEPLRTAVPGAASVQAWLNAVGAPDAMEKPALVDYPETPTITEVRYGHFSGDDVLTIKIVETREYTKLLGTREQARDRFSKEYQRVSVRAANVVALHGSGLVELRVPRHGNGSKNYVPETSRLWSAIAALIDPTSVRKVNLVKAKNQLYRRRHTLDGVISFSGTLLRNSEGINVSAACGRRANLFASGATEAGLATMVEDGDAYHDALNLWWKAQAGGVPSEDIHVLLGGDSNEFALTRRCSRADYDHILAAILAFNQ